MFRFAVLTAFLFAIGLSGNSMAKTEESKPADVVILDVRTPSEFREQAVEGAINIDVTDSRFLARVNELNKTLRYKLYCRSGARSGMAEKLMKGEGFKNLENLGSVTQAAKTLGRKCLPKGC